MTDSHPVTHLIFAPIACYTLPDFAPIPKYYGRFSIELAALRQSTSHGPNNVGG
jgi:hypothetical protein